MGDGLGMDLKLSNQVFNSLKQHCYSEQRRSARLHEKKEHSTAVRAQTVSDMELSTFTQLLHCVSVLNLHYVL